MCTLSTLPVFLHHIHYKKAGLINIFALHRSFLLYIPLCATAIHVSLVKYCLRMLSVVGGASIMSALKSDKRLD